MAPTKEAGVTVLLDRPCPLLPDVRGDATRRQFILGAASLAALLAGCGTSTRTAPDTPKSQGRFPVTIAHKYGSTEIPGPPLRNRIR